MSNEPLNDTQRREVELMQDLHIRKYLEKLVPLQEQAQKNHVVVQIKLHDEDDKAHGGVELKVNKFTWTLYGWGLACLGGGAAIGKMLSSL